MRGLFAKVKEKGRNEIVDLLDRMNTASTRPRVAQARTETDLVKKANIGEEEIFVNPQGW